MLHPVNCSQLRVKLLGETMIEETINLNVLDHFETTAGGAPDFDVLDHLHKAMAEETLNLDVLDGLNETKAECQNWMFWTILKKLYKNLGT